ncbi:MAG: DUF898 family protein, partial [Magnetococcales bacterium]|nr:DUF898 family protein [Magnetococcales bacterium]
LAWINISNLFLIILTAGLFYPWAKVRATRYMVNSIRLNSSASLDEFVAGENEAVSALGEEFGDMMDLDFGG